MWPCGGGTTQRGEEHQDGRGFRQRGKPLLIGVDMARRRLLAVLSEWCVDRGGVGGLDLKPAVGLPVSSTRRIRVSAGTVRFPVGGRTTARWPRLTLG